MHTIIAATAAFLFGLWLGHPRAEAAWSLGPIGYLRIGRLWSLDLWRVGLVGVGWQVTFRRVDQ